MNPIMELLNSRSSNNSLNQSGNGVFNIINQVRNAADPSSMFQSMLTTSPQLQQVMNYIQSQGGDARQAFYNLAQQRGVDPQSILDQLK